MERDREREPKLGGQRGGICLQHSSVVSSLAALALMAACGAQTQKPETDLGKPTGPPALKAAVDPPVDKATADFQAEAAAIESEMKSKSVDWDNVVGRMESLTQRHPSYGLAWYNMGVAYEQLGKEEQATRAYHQAVRHNSKIREAEENLAVMAQKKGEGSQAISILRGLVERDPGAAAARVALASSHLESGEYEDAERLCEEALAREPRNLRAYCVLAGAAVRQNNHRRARLLIAQGLKIEAEAACLHQTLGLIALQEKETAISLMEFERAVAKDPALIEARFQIASISLGFKDFKKAIDSYAAVTQVEPKNAAAYINLGVALKGNGRFSEAEKAYLKAVEVGGEAGAAAAYFNLGVLYLRNLNRHEDAKTNLKHYLQVANAESGDPAFQLLEEIDQMKAMQEEEKRVAEEAVREEEIEKKRAEEEARSKAEREKEETEEKRREAEIERKAKESGEPVDPSKVAPTDGSSPPTHVKKKPTSEPQKERKAPPKKQEERQKEAPEAAPRDFE